jgi:hypothetical protein
VVSSVVSSSSLHVVESFIRRYKVNRLFDMLNWLVECC